MNSWEITHYAIHQIRFAKDLLNTTSTRVDEAADRIAPTRMSVANMFHGLDLPFSEEETIWVSVK